MVLIKHNYLKSDIFFNPIFIPGFSGSKFLGSGSWVRVQVIEVASFHSICDLVGFFRNLNIRLVATISNSNCVLNPLHNLVI